MALDNPLNGCQPYPGSGKLVLPMQALKRLEKAIGMSLIETSAIVLDRNSCSIIKSLALLTFIIESGILLVYFQAFPSKLVIRTSTVFGSP